MDRTPTFTVFLCLGEKETTKKRLRRIWIQSRPGKRQAGNTNFINAVRTCKYVFWWNAKFQCHGDMGHQVVTHFYWFVLTDARICKYPTIRWWSSVYDQNLRVYKVWLNWVTTGDFLSRDPIFISDGRKWLSGLKTDGTKTEFLGFINAEIINKKKRTSCLLPQDRKE